jgi:hypothetical protein
MLKVTGRVYTQETGEGLPGLLVKAVDKDLLFDDVLGTAVTDQDGRFEITYDQKDFSELFEKGPDLYVIVRDPKSNRIIYSSEDSVRCDVGAEENIDIPIPQRVLDAESGVPQGPYGPANGEVKIKLAAIAGLPAETKLFFTEHRSQSRKQHQVSARTGNEISVNLPSGEYTMQIVAPGFETMRGLVEVDPKRPFVFDATPQPRARKASTFAERLVKYEIDAKKTDLGELNVPPGTTLALNHKTDREKRGFKMLQTDTIAKLKQWIGSDDSRFGHDRPVYGPLPNREFLAKLNQDRVDFQTLNADETQAVMAIAREYVQGNSRSVTAYESVLNDAIKLTVRDGLSKFPLYFYKIVTIGAGATLEIGNGSAIFSCDELRIHKTGKLKPVANVTIEIGTYTEFE